MKRENRTRETAGGTAASGLCANVNVSCSRYLDARRAAFVPAPVPSGIRSSHLLASHITPFSVFSSLPQSAHSATRNEFRSLRCSTSRSTKFIFNAFFCLLAQNSASIRQTWACAIADVGCPELIRFQRFILIHEQINYGQTFEWIHFECTGKISQTTFGVWQNARDGRWCGRSSTAQNTSLRSVHISDRQATAGTNGVLTASERNHHLFRDEFR